MSELLFVRDLLAYPDLTISFNGRVYKVISTHDDEIILEEITYDDE